MSKNVSNSFKSVIKKAGPFYAYAKITLSNGTEFILDSVDDFMDSENSYSEQPDSGFPLGLALSKSIKISIDSKVAIEEVLQDTLSEDIKDSSNDNIKTYIEKTLKDLFMARIVLYTEADLDNGTKERIQEGIFTVIDAVYPGDVIEITAYDDMYKADQIFTSHSSFPTSAQTLLNEVCGSCDITLGSATFRNNNFQIQQAPEGKTGRQVIGYIAQIAAGNAVISPQGRLIIKSYDVNFPEGENPSASEIESESGIHIISQYIDDPTIGVDDVTITGVSTNIENEDSGEDEIYLSGSDDYSIKIDNPLIVGHEKNAVDMIAQSIIGIKMRPFSGNFMPDPTIEFMDLAYLIDKKDNAYQTIVTAHNFTYLGSSALECGAESPARFGEYYSDASEVYQKAKDQIRKNKTQWEQAIENLTNQVANASGFYVTEEEQSDGSVIAYMHNKPTLEESNYVWKMTSESISVSTDGGEHWNGGITVNGEVIATIMSTIGINFDWGVGGTLSIQDSDGNQTMYLDAETGVVRINAASLKITGKTIEEIIDEHPVSVNLTQEEIFNILTNNGKSEGIFMEDGQLYINLSYAKAGTLSADYIKGGHISADLIQGGSMSASVITSGTMSADRISGGSISADLIEGGSLTIGGSNNKYGVIRILNSDGSLGAQIESGHFRTYPGSRYSFVFTGDIRIGNNSSFVCLSYAEFDHDVKFTDDVDFKFKTRFWTPAVMYNLSHVTSGGHIVFARDGQTLAYLASSSKKYKDHIRDLTDEEAEKLLNTRVVWFKYKENYLNENDPMKGKEIPGFYAEEVEEISPVLIQYNDKNEAEDWNYRTMIPLMMQLIKKQSKEIDDLKKSIEDLKSLISK